MGGRRRARWGCGRNRRNWRCKMRARSRSRDCLRDCMRCALRMTGRRAVETGQQSSGFIGDDGGFEIGAGEVADGFEGMPVGLDDNFDFVIEAAKGNGGSQVARDAAELAQNIFGKVFEIFGQLRFGGVGGPAPQDGSGWSNRGSWQLVADDYVPGADFPFFREAVDD